MTAGKFPPDFDVQEFVNDPEARYVCPRYHGPLDPYYHKLRHTYRAAALQGRGRCSSCEHQVFFAPDTQLLMQPVPKLCAQCALKEAGATIDVLRSLDAELSHCLETPCPYGALE